MSEFIVNGENFWIVNTSTNKPLESWATEKQARHFCDSLNRRELKYNRQPCYIVTKPYKVVQNELYKN